MTLPLEAAIEFTGDDNPKCAKCGEILKDNECCFSGRLYYCEPCINIFAEFLTLEAQALLDSGSDVAPWARDDDLLWCQIVEELIRQTGEFEEDDNEDNE